MRKRHGLTHDVLRHSFISFHVAAFRSVGDAALEAGNTEGVVKAHYLNAATVAQETRFGGFLLRAIEFPEPLPSRECSSPSRLITLSFMSETDLHTAPDNTPREIDLDGLFWLCLQTDGTYRAEFGKVTAPRELALRWKLQPESFELARAFHAILADFDLKVFSTDLPRIEPGVYPKSIHLLELYSLASKSLAWGCRH